MNHTFIELVCLTIALLTVITPLAIWSLLRSHGEED
jgi:hypothetical protein